MIELIALLAVFTVLGGFAGYCFGRVRFAKNKYAPYLGLSFLLPFTGILVVPRHFLSFWFICTEIFFLASFLVGDVIASKRNFQEKKEEEILKAAAAIQRIPTLERIARILGKYEDYTHLPASSVTRETLLQPLYESDPLGIKAGASVFYVEVLTEFYVEDIPEEIMDSWKTVGDVVDYIDAQLKKSENLE